LPVLETKASIGDVAVPSSLAVAYSGTPSGHSARLGKRAPLNTPPASRLSPGSICVSGRQRRQGGRPPPPRATAPIRARSKAQQRRNNRLGRRSRSTAQSPRRQSQRSRSLPARRSRRARSPALPYEWPRADRLQSRASVCPSEPSASLASRTRVAIACSAFRPQERGS